MTAPNTGRAMVDVAMRVDRLDETGLRVVLGYLVGVAVNVAPVRRALVAALDAADTAADQWSTHQTQRHPS